jgi:hypothetical protein
LTKFNSHGVPQRHSTYVISYDDSVLSVESPADGGVVIFGRTSPISAPGDDLFLTKIDSTGMVEWARFIDQPDPMSYSGAAFLLRIDETGEIANGCAVGQPTAYSSQPIAATAPHTPVSRLAVSRSTRVSNLIPEDITVVEADQCADRCQVQFLSHGTGLAGSGAYEPSLNGIDGYCRGHRPWLQIGSGLGSANGLLLASLAVTSQPFFGGTLYINPADAFSISLRLGGVNGVAGAGALEFPISADLHACLDLDIYLQAAFLDPAAPAGISLSNAVQMSVVDL